DSVGAAKMDTVALKLPDHVPAVAVRHEHGFAVLYCLISRPVSRTASLARAVGRADAPSPARLDSGASLPCACDGSMRLPRQSPPATPRRQSRMRKHNWYRGLV